MIPQGTSPLNTQWFTSLITQINRCNGCAELQSLVNQVFASLNAYLDGIEAQNTLLAPMQALTTAPTSPTEAVTWIQSFISSYLSPQLVAYVTYATKLTQLATQIPQLESAITSAASRFKSCSITIPPITIP